MFLVNKLTYKSYLNKYLKTVSLSKDLFINLIIRKLSLL